MLIYNVTRWHNVFVIPIWCMICFACILKKKNPSQKFHLLCLQRRTRWCSIKITKVLFFATFLPRLSGNFYCTRLSTYLRKSVAPHCAVIIIIIQCDTQYYNSMRERRRIRMQRIDLQICVRCACNSVRARIQTYYPISDFIRVSASRVCTHPFVGT